MLVLGQDKQIESTVKTSMLTQIVEIKILLLINIYPQLVTWSVSQTLTDPVCIPHTNF